MYTCLIFSKTFIPSKERRWRCNPCNFSIRTLTHIHTHVYTYIYIHIISGSPFPDHRPPISRFAYFSNKLGNNQVDLLVPMLAQEEGGGGSGGGRRSSGTTSRSSESVTDPSQGRSGAPVCSNSRKGPSPPFRRRRSVVASRSERASKLASEREREK